MNTNTTSDSTIPGSFQPDYAVAPGETLAEWLDERGMRQSELALRVNMSEKALSQVITGTVPLTRATAAKLEIVTGIPARTWNNLESLYQDDRERVERAKEMEAQSEFLTEMPVKQLRKLGLLTASSRDKAGVMRQFLEFFGVSDPAAWRRLWLGPQAAALKQSRAYQVDPAAVAAWLRIGELEADALNVAPFDASRLRATLPQLRVLTREDDPEVFAERLVSLVAQCGVALVFVPEITGARCSGAARWVHGRPVVQLSRRFGTDDQLWFAVFHELAHVLLHGRRDAFITDGQTDHEAHGSKEAEADQFARDLLVPPRYASELSTLHSLDAISAFAERIGVSPGVVVGRLQRDGHLKHPVGDSLKLRFTLGESRQE
ncbi:MAG: XRE family transcriptional regulator [Actinomycetota bacterium]|nr:XRE family transcriptional regulator [Actinomycetota bacterium]